jgi:hypothetical protein
VADPINLNRARKAKARAVDQARAAENRVKFGRTKAERMAAQAEAARLARALDDAKRED